MANELVGLVRASGFRHLEISCLPAALHNRPERIPAAVARRIHETRGRYARTFVAYADCGTGGALDRVLAVEGVERLPGAHCYEVYAGGAPFAALMDEEPGTFFLTDFLARHFDRLVIGGLGIDRFPELRDAYFGQYRRVVYLSQRDDPALLDAARRAAATLGLDFQLHRAGVGALGASVAALAS